MKKVVLATAALATAAAGIVVARQVQEITGPQTLYWVSASTTSGILETGNTAPPTTIGQAISQTLPEPAPPGGVHTLTLELGSKSTPPGPPLAAHRPPVGFNGGTSLALLQPLAAQARPDKRQDPISRFRKERPDGRVFLYWGCGEHAGARQPLMIEFPYLTEPGYASNLKWVMQGMPLWATNPPASAAWPTRGAWTSTRTPMSVAGSLVGNHEVQGNYTPDIDFSLTQDQDFMAPIALDSRTRLPSGAIDLHWSEVKGAKAFLATVIGSAGAKSLVIWTSSEPGPGGALAPPYFGNDDLQRLTADNWLLPSTSKSCTVPREVVQALIHGGSASITAYGGDLDFAYPPRPSDPRIPWRIKWQAKIRYRSSTTGRIGDAVQPAGRPDQKATAISPHGRPHPTDAPLLVAGKGR